MSYVSKNNIHFTIISSLYVALNITHARATVYETTNSLMREFPNPIGQEILIIGEVGGEGGANGR